MDYNILPSVLHIEISSILLLKISHLHLCNIDRFCPTEKKKNWQDKHELAR